MCIDYLFYWLTQAVLHFIIFCFLSIFLLNWHNLVSNISPQFKAKTSIRGFFLYLHHVVILAVWMTFVIMMALSVAFSIWEGEIFAATDHGKVIVLSAGQCHWDLSIFNSLWCSRRNGICWLLIWQYWLLSSLLSSLLWLYS